MYNKKLVFAAACLGMLLFGIVLTSLGSILPVITERFHMDQLTAGSLVSILPFGVLAGSLIFGPIVDKYGYKFVLITCIILVLFGLQGLNANEFYLLQLGIFLIGFGGGVINGGTNALVADISDEKGANLSLLGVFFGIGALGLPSLLSIFPGLQSTIINAVGIFMSLPLIFILAVRFPAPKNPQGFPLMESGKLLKSPVLYLLSFVLFFESGMEGMVSNWTTTFISKTLVEKSELALVVLSSHIAGLTVARLILGWVLKKVSPVKVLYASIGIIILSAVIIILSNNINLSIIGFALLGAGFAAGFPITLGFVGENFPKLSGTAFSIALVIALVGNMLINYIMGAVSYYTHISNMPLVLGICAILMLVLISFYSKKYITKS
ncbi:MAG: MFS transporter [Syntrophothermus sp.]|nr:MFS transporter [Ignavibacteriaceae bacterium]